MFGCWHALHPLCPWVTLAPASSRGISVLAHCRGAFGCDGRWSREKAWPVLWGRTELWDISFCVLVMATIIRAVGMGTRAAGSAPLWAGAECGVTSGFPPSLESGWEKPRDAMEPALGAPPGTGGVAGQCCGVADGLAAHCCPGNCLSSPES